MTFIAGHLATVTLNSVDFSAVGSVFSLNLSRSMNAKPTFGNSYGNVLGGQRNGSFSASGHVSAEQIEALQGLFAADNITFSLQIGTASAATDGGTYTGNCVVGSFTIDVNADGEWDWSIDAQTDGTVTYTAAASSSS